MRILENVRPEDMHPVSPGNSNENDRVLCGTCHEEYNRRKSELLESRITQQLLGWIDKEEKERMI